MSQKRCLSTSDSPRSIVDDVEDNQSPLAHRGVLSSQPNGTGIDPSGADERRRALQRRLLSSEGTNPERQVGPSTLSYGNNQPHRGHLIPPDSPQWVPIPDGQTTTPSMPYENISGTENPSYGNADFETDPEMTQPQASYLHNAHNPPLCRFQGTYITVPPEQQIPSHSSVPLPQFNYQEQRQRVQSNLDTDGGMTSELRCKSSSPQISLSWSSNTRLLSSILQRLQYKMPQRVQSYHKQTNTNCWRSSSSDSSPRAAR
ncbi:MAG: hypothetical protein Q9198_002723 [Flavoplaca austrocitrina]